MIAQKPLKKTRKKGRGQVLKQRRLKTTKEDGTEFDDKVFNCPFFKKRRARNSRKFFPYLQEIMDLEDWTELGKEFKFCPYFFTKDALEVVDLVLMPYNYIFNYEIRNTIRIGLGQNILIVDEGHNIEK